MVSYSPLLFLTLPSNLLDLYPLFFYILDDNWCGNIPLGYIDLLNVSYCICNSLAWGSNPILSVSSFDNRFLFYKKGLFSSFFFSANYLRTYALLLLKRYLSANYLHV
jgi:hypothetical protein